MTYNVFGGTLNLTQLNSTTKDVKHRTRNPITANNITVHKFSHFRLLMWVRCVQCWM